MVPPPPPPAEVARALVAANRRLWLALALAPWLAIAGLFWWVGDLRREVAAAEAARQADHELLEQYNSVDAFKRLDAIIKFEEARSGMGGER